MKKTYCAPQIEVVPCFTDNLLAASTLNLGDPVADGTAEVKDELEWFNFEGKTGEDIFW